MCCKKYLTEKKKYLQDFLEGKTIDQRQNRYFSFLKTFDDKSEMMHVLFNQIQSQCFNFIG